MGACHGVAGAAEERGDGACVSVQVGYKLAGRRAGNVLKRGVGIGSGAATIVMRDGGGTGGATCCGADGTLVFQIRVYAVEVGHLFCAATISASACATLS